VIAQEDKPEPVPEEPMRWGPTTTVNDAIAAWNESGWSDLSPKTTRGYEEIWQRYVLDSFGRRRIASLNPYEVERYFRSLKSNGAGQSTVGRVKALLHPSCRLVAKWSSGRLTNPVTNAELPLPTDIPGGDGTVQPASGSGGPKAGGRGRGTSPRNSEILGQSVDRGNHTPRAGR
jgi:hypothetical protein